MKSSRIAQFEGFGVEVGHHAEDPAAFAHVGVRSSERMKSATCRSTSSFPLGRGVDELIDRFEHADLAE